MARPGAAGFGQMLARPLFRERHRPDMSAEDAVKLLHEGLRVCHTDKHLTVALLLWLTGCCS